MWATRSCGMARYPTFFCGATGVSYGDGAVVCVRLPPNQQDDSARKCHPTHTSRGFTHTLSRAHTHYSLASALVPQHFNERISEHIPMSDSYVNRYFALFPSLISPKVLLHHPSIVARRGGLPLVVVRREGYGKRERREAVCFLSICQKTISFGDRHRRALLVLGPLHVLWAAAVSDLQN